MLLALRDPPWVHWVQAQTSARCWTVACATLDPEPLEVSTVYVASLGVLCLFSPASCSTPSLGPSGCGRMEARLGELGMGEEERGLEDGVWAS